MPLMQGLKAVMEGFTTTAKQDRPIGLRHLTNFSDDELLNQLARPTAPLPTFSPVEHKRVLTQTAPVFAGIPPADYSYQAFSKR